MKVSVIVFPGSNCDHDVVNIYERLLKQPVQAVWHKESDLRKPDIVILPGGFAFGDYLRTGAMAKISPIMSEVAQFAKAGGPVLGVCNGFQILCEVGLLPGVLLQNACMRFLSQFVHIKVENNRTPFTYGYSKGEVITCPIAHFDGNYFIDPEGLRKIEENGQVVFRYCDAEGTVNNAPETNPNGSLNSIAGIANEQGNVVGLMPHPDRAAESIIGYIGHDTGRKVFESSIQSNSA